MGQEGRHFLSKRGTGILEMVPPMVRLRLWDLIDLGAAFHRGTLVLNGSARGRGRHSQFARTSTPGTEEQGERPAPREQADERREEAHRDS